MSVRLSAACIELTFNQNEAHHQQNESCRLCVHHFAELQQVAAGVALASSALLLLAKVAHDMIQVCLRL
jgi:hypothetical protein